MEFRLEVNIIYMRETNVAFSKRHKLNIKKKPT